MAPRAGKDRAYKDGKSDGEGLRTIHQLSEQQFFAGVQLLRAAHDQYYGHVSDFSSPYFTNAEDELWYTRGFLEAYMRGETQPTRQSPSYEYDPSLWQRLVAFFSGRRPYIPAPVDGEYNEEYREVYPDDIGQQ